MNKVFTKRAYNKWTPEDIEMLRQGDTPPNHPSYANCYAQAKKNGFTFVRKKTNVWTDHQEKMLREGVLPIDKDIESAIKRGKELGFDFLTLFYEKHGVDNLDGLSREDRMIVLAANNSSLKDYKVRDTIAIQRAAERGKKYFLMHAKSFMSITDIAKKEHCTRQNIHRLIDAYKIYYFNKNCYDQAVKEAENESS